MFPILHKIRGLFETCRFLFILYVFVIPSKPLLPKPFSGYYCQSIFFSYFIQRSRDARCMSPCMLHKVGSVCPPQQWPAPIYSLRVGNFTQSFMPFFIIAFCGVRCVSISSHPITVHYFLTMHSYTVRYCLTLPCCGSGGGGKYL